MEGDVFEVFLDQGESFQYPAAGTAHAASGIGTDGTGAGVIFSVTNSDGSQDAVKITRTGETEIDYEPIANRRYFFGQDAIRAGTTLRSVKGSTRVTGLQARG